MHLTIAKKLQLRQVRQQPDDSVLKLCHRVFEHVIVHDSRSPVLQRLAQQARLFLYYRRVLVLTDLTNRLLTLKSLRLHEFLHVEVHI